MSEIGILLKQKALAFLLQSLTDHLRKENGHMIEDCHATKHFVSVDIAPYRFDVIGCLKSENRQCWLSLCYEHGLIRLRHW